MLQIYTETKNQLSSLSKKEGGNFFNRDIKDLIYEHDANPHCFCETEHLTTLVVILGKKSVNDWYTNYESIDKFVVPRSSQLVSCFSFNCIFIEDSTSKTKTEHLSIPLLYSKTLLML